MRTFLRATIGLGRIAIPVGLASTHVDGDVGFKTLHRDCEKPITMKVWCPVHERALEDGDEVVKGFEVAAGQYVLVEPEELRAIAPTADPTLELFAFVEAAELDPISFDRGYHLKPSEQALMRRGYKLLAGALAETALVGICRFVAWDSEHVGAIRSTRGGTLALHVLRPLEDLVDTGEVEAVLADVEIDEAEAHLVRELVMRLFDPLERLDLSDLRRPRVRALIDAKLAGREIVKQAPPDPGEAQLPLAEPDLSGALKRSIRETRGALPGRKPKPKRKAAAKRKRVPAKT